MPEVLIPEYVQEFHCIGGACENNCCHGWKVYIDKKTYQKYMACTNPRLKEAFRKSLTREGTGHQYAAIALDEETGNCPFLQADGLCEVQLNMGEGALSATCSVYPRIEYAVNDGQEISLTMSCPEAVRCALMNETPMGFTRTNLPPPIGPSRLSLPKGRDIEVFGNIRMFIIWVLQNRRVAFEDRLILLGLFLQKLGQTPTKKMEALAEQYKVMFRDPSIGAQVASLPVVPEMQYLIVTEVISSIVSQSSTPEYSVLLDDVMHGLGMSKGLDTKEMFARYVEAAGRYKECAPSFDHVFENYFVNATFQKPVPIAMTISETEKNAAWEWFMEMCVTYLVMKFHFTGMYEQNGGKLEDADAVRIISLVTRCFFAHNEEKTKSLIIWLREQSFDTLGAMATLVRS